MLEYGVWVTGKEGKASIQKAFMIWPYSNKTTTKSTLEFFGFLPHFLRRMPRHVVIAHNLVDDNSNSFAYRGCVLLLI